MFTASPVSPSRQLTPSASTSTPPPSQNPLSIRLYKVLATKFDDESTKEALDTLAELYAPLTSLNGHASGNGKGKEKAVDAEVEEDDDYSDLEELDDDPVDIRKRNGVLSTGAVPGELVPGEIAARARKNLKRDVQTRLAESSRMFLDAFAEVDKVSTCRVATFV